MISVKVNKTDRTDLYLQVAAEIRRAIAEGEAKPGERLPPARDLATVLGVNTNTVLRSLRLLQDEGLLELRRRRGITVAGTPERGAVIQKVRELVEFARGRWMAILSVAAIAGAAPLVVLQPYLTAARELGPRDWTMVAAFVPRLRSWLAPPPWSLLLSGWLLAARSPMTTWRSPIITGIVCSLPSRLMRTLTDLPTGVFATTSRSTAPLAIFVPSISMITSPACKPALAAGPPGITS